MAWQAGCLLKSLLASCTVRQRGWQWRRQRRLTAQCVPWSWAWTIKQTVQRHSGSLAGCLGTQALAIPFELKFISQLPYLELEDLRLFKRDSSTASDVIVQQRPMLEVLHNQVFQEDLEICFRWSCWLRFVCTVCICTLLTHNNFKWCPPQGRQVYQQVLPAQTFALSMLVFLVQQCPVRQSHHRQVPHTTSIQHWPGHCTLMLMLRPVRHALVTCPSNLGQLQAAIVTPVIDCPHTGYLQ